MKHQLLCLLTFSGRECQQKHEPAAVHGSSLLDLRDASLQFIFITRQFELYPRPPSCFIIQHHLQTVREKNKSPHSSNFRHMVGVEQILWGSEAEDLNPVLVPTLKYLQVVRQTFLHLSLDFLSGIMESLSQIWEPMNPVYLLTLSKLNYCTAAVC